MKSQTATATIDSSGTCAGDTVLVPVNVTDFNNIGAMTLFIGYDTNYAEYISIVNINPSIPGAMNVNVSDGQIGIAYSHISGFTIANGKLFDLRYLLISNSSLLTFEPGTEIANVNLEVIPLDTNNGGIFNAITITDQPDSVQAYPDTDVTFTVLASGNNIAYQWEENSGSGWISLSNNSTYSGVNTETLNIFDVALSFSGNTYRCILSAGDCELSTDVALLEVNTAFPVTTIGQVTSCPDQIVEVPVFAGDLFDIIEFTYNISFNSEVLEFNSLENVHPELQAGSLNTSPLVSPNGISIHWENTNPVSITSGKLFDMQYTYTAANTQLEFIAGTEVINSQLNLVNITLTDGHVYQHELPVILTQPESQTVKQNEMAFFSVESIGTTGYQWMVSTDEGASWNDLTNTIPYYNVQTPELTIDPVTWSLNNFQYACEITGEYCTIMSEAAILSVDTLTWAKENHLAKEAGLKINPNPVANHTTLTWEGKWKTGAVIRIFALNGQVVESIQKEDTQVGTNHLAIDLSHLEAGLYFLEMKIKGPEEEITQRAKLIKVLN